MHRDKLLQLLAVYRERWPAEAEMADRFETFVRRCPDCFRRELQEGHITGSAWIVSECGKETLLTHHRKLDIWVQTGGHCDGDSDVLSVALREAFEETGLSELEPVSKEIFDLDIHTIPERKGEPEHLHYDVRFALRQGGDSDFTVTEESHDLAWVPLEKLEDYTTESDMARMRDKTTQESIFP